MGEVLVARYWCHMCSQMVSPVMEVEIKCPFCDSGFVEEMEGRDHLDSSDLRSDQSLSLWAPVLLGMVGSGSSHRHRLRRDEEDDDWDPDHEFISLLRRRRRRSSALLRFLQDLEEGNRSDSDSTDSERVRERGRDRERDRAGLILIDAFNHALFLDGSLDNHSQGEGSDITIGASVGDYYLGLGLDALLQHLAENDPNRYGTPPAEKEAVNALPTVKIDENMSCSVCLEDFEVGSEAKEMPCKHSFHSGCLLPWLELHSSCPICRFQLPADESKRSSGADSGSRAESSGGDGDDRHNGSGLLVPVPWSMDELFSSLRLQNGGGNSSSNPSSSSSGGNSYADDN